MPKHRDPDCAVRPDLLKAAKQIQLLLDGVLEHAQDSEAFEGELKAVLDTIGRAVMQSYLEGLGSTEAFVEDGKRWRVALRRRLKRIMTLFGWVTVERSLFRDSRSGPTRCLIAEKADLIDGRWTPRAARVAAFTTTELSFERSEQFLREASGMNPCRTILLGLDRYLSGLWEADREHNEQQVRHGSEVPSQAVACMVSLDGVMVHMTGSKRAELRKRRVNAGQNPTGPNGYREASVGVLSFYDAEGERLATWRTARMPEARKATTQKWLTAELAFVRQRRPDLLILAAADGAAPNWTFLESLEPDEQVVDYYHVAEYLHREISRSAGSWPLSSQAKLSEWKRKLLEQDNGIEDVSAELLAIRRKHGSRAKTKTTEEQRKRPLSYFERHRDRMSYKRLLDRNLPIGTGVTEGTCRHLVVDRLRRSGMAWSQTGGQAVMTLRALVVSDRFDLGWNALRSANRRRRYRAVA